MKKAICIIIMLGMIAFEAVAFSANAGVIRGNQARCIDAAKRIGELDGVEQAVVMKHRGRIIAGVRCNSRCAEQVSKQSESIIKGLFPLINGCRVEAENENARKIIEFSYFLDTDIKRSIQNGRFEFLWNI